MLEFAKKGILQKKKKKIHYQPLNLLLYLSAWFTKKIGYKIGLAHLLVMDLC